MCICLNCNYVIVCKSYFLVEKNHKETNLNSNDEFVPSQTITNINFLSTKKNLEIEWDIIECLSFKEKPAKWIYFI